MRAASTTKLPIKIVFTLVPPDALRDCASDSSTNFVLIRFVFCCCVFERGDVLASDFVFDSATFDDLAFEVAAAAAFDVVFC